MNTLTVALSKGRILQETLPLLEAADIKLSDDPDNSRKLILETKDPSVNIVVIRATDVPTYVQYGAADIGVAGKDVLMEHGGEGLYEVLDLKLAPCRLMVAGKKDSRLRNRRLTVASKYVNVTRDYFAARGIKAEIIKLYGSMELAPLVGLADLIVDLVDTGNTLKANGLEPQELIADISSRLIVNKASMKMKHARVQQFIEKLASTVNKN